MLQTNTSLRAVLILLYCSHLGLVESVVAYVLISEPVWSKWVRVMGFCASGARIRCSNFCRVIITYLSFNLVQIGNFCLFTNDFNCHLSRFSPFLQNDGHLDCPLSANMGKTHRTASFAKTKDEWLICCWG